MNTPWDRRNNHFDFLRLGLSLLVILSHSFPLGVGSEANEPMSRLTHGQMTLGAVAVDLFFVMSGFLITASAERSKSLAEYFRKRALRIYPGFVVAALLGFALFAPLGHATLLAGRWEPVADFLLQTLRLREFTNVHAFAGNPYPGAINGSLWSVQYEFWCYVGVALVVAAGLLRRRALSVALFVAAWGASLFWLVRGVVMGGKVLGVVFGSPQLWARLLPYYLAGVAFYAMRDRIPHSRLLAWMCVAALVAACLLPYGWTILFPIAGTYLVLFVAFQQGVPLPKAGRYGDFSYGTYLYAFPVQQLLAQALPALRSPWLLFAVAAPLTMACAVGSWYCVERPFLRPAKRAVKAIALVEAEQPA